MVYTCLEIDWSRQFRENLCFVKTTLIFRTNKGLSMSCVEHDQRCTRMLVFARYLVYEKTRLDKIKLAKKAPIINDRVFF